MGIFKKGRFWWLWLERPGQPALRESTKLPWQGRNSWETKQTRKDAEDLYRARMTELARGRYDLPTGPPTNHTVAEWLTWYDTHIASTHRGYRVRERYILAGLKDRLGHYALRALDAEALAEWRTARLKAVSPRTWNRERDVLLHALRAAVPKHLAAVPVLPREKTADVEPRALTVEEEERLKLVMAPADWALFVLCLDTLMRLGDALNLKWEDVRGTMIRVTNAKTGKPHVVPMSTRLQSVLKVVPRESEYVFPHRRRAEEVYNRSNGVKQMFELYCLKAGVRYGRKRGVTWHSATRHTGATRMVTGGADLRTVQEIGGWASLDMLQRYSHPGLAQKRAAVDLVDRSPDTHPVDVN